MSDEHLADDSALVESTPSDHLDFDDVPEPAIQEFLDEDEDVSELTSQEMANLRARVQEMRLGASVSTAALVEEAERLVRETEAA